MANASDAAPAQLKSVNWLITIIFTVFRVITRANSLKKLTKTFLSLCQPKTELNSGVIAAPKADPASATTFLFCRVARAAAKPPVLSQAKCVALSTSFSTQDARTWQPIQPCLRKFSPDLPAIRMSMESSLSVLAARQSDTKSCAKRSVP